MDRPLTLHHRGLRATQGGCWPSGWGPRADLEVLVLADHVLDAAQGGPSFLVDGGLHIGGGWLLLAHFSFMTTSIPLPLAAGSTLTVQG